MYKNSGKWDDLECDKKLPSVCEGKAVCGKRIFLFELIYMIKTISMIRLMKHISALYSDQLINSLDDRFKGQCSGAYEVNYSTCCSNGECNEGEGKDIKTIFEEMGILTLTLFFPIPNDIYDLFPFRTMHHR